jgi:hypothetical protein
MDGLCHLAPAFRFLRSPRYDIFPRFSFSSTFEPLLSVERLLFPHLTHRPTHRPPPGYGFLLAIPCDLGAGIMPN